MRNEWPEGRRKRRAVSEPKKTYKYLRIGELREMLQGIPDDYTVEFHKHEDETTAFAVEQIYQTDLGLDLQLVEVKRKGGKW